jgi:hypothetical protein
MLVNVRQFLLSHAPLSPGRGKTCLLFFTSMTYGGPKQHFFKHILSVLQNSKLNCWVELDDTEQFSKSVGVFLDANVALHVLLSCLASMDKM